ncbi:MAG: glycerol kinase GlpK [Rhodospirillaceae bacterium]|jgi:glycerol kinase|nr:glycerol kinase GlpK [Rhodospirillaceae bacterium]MBT5809979.1 glycerol kinase GlpK [Rhodospirillaceae bacterium]
MTILAIDQGTTSTRAIVFDEQGAPRAVAQMELPQIFPRPGWVEHDGEEIWRATVQVCRDAMAKAHLTASDIAAIGIANQRETTLLWDRATGAPLHNAIVWQDRRTGDVCDDLRGRGLEPMAQAKTGLLLDPYFSATKLAWLLDHVDGARAKAEAGELAFGTVDSFLLWRLTGGSRQGGVHATDATNAARTMLFNIHDQSWDDELLEAFRIPRAVLPRVLDNTADFGVTEAALFGAPIAISGMAGDQQAAAIGQACMAPGMVKSTYGTGCFALVNTGATAAVSTNKLLTTIAYRMEGEVAYALEGSIFVAGAAVQWLRDGLGVVTDAAQTDALARAARPDSEVCLVPAFTGLGAPHWDPDARGAMYGLTRDSGPAELTRAALESVGFQTRDLFDAFSADGAEMGIGAGTGALRVDGGMVANDWAMQFLADILDCPVERAAMTETTALGAAALAGMQAGVYPGPEELARRWKCGTRFEPTMTADDRDVLLARWRNAVRRTLNNG